MAIAAAMSSQPAASYRAAGRSNLASLALQSTLGTPLDIPLANHCHTRPTPRAIGCAV